jgi:hypothetical protein
MNRRRQSPLPTIIAIVCAVALGISLFANWSLVETGEFRLPGFSQPIVQAATKKKADEEAKQMPEMQAVFVPARNLEPYHQVSIDDFYRDDGTFSTMLVAKSTLANSSAFLSPNQSIGRVLQKSKSKNQAFHPSDFFPEGTQPGITAGVPAGMVGKWIDCTKVAGLEGLAMGDTVDLMATSTMLPVDPNLTPEERARVETERRMSGLDKQAEVRRVVELARVVAPARDRMDANTKKSTREIFIAMAPDQSVALAASLQVGDQVFAIARSGRIEETNEFQLPELVPQNPLTPVENLPKPAMVESIEGGERTTVEVPQSSR